MLLQDMDTGNVYASYPVEEGESFSVTFLHSVNRSPVTDVYEIRGGKIFVVKTIYEAFGAGVQTELQEGQTLTYGDEGEMIVSGFQKEMTPLSYFVGTVSDHVLHIRGTDISLRGLCGENSAVSFLCR